MWIPTANAPVVAYSVPAPAAFGAFGAIGGASVPAASLLAAQARGTPPPVAELLSEILGEEGASTWGGSGAPGRSPRSEKSRRARADARLTGVRLELLRRVLLEHRACLDGVSAGERSVLVRRAGLFGYAPASRGEIARTLGISRALVTRVEAGALRRLTASGCDGARSSPVVANGVRHTGGLSAADLARALGPLSGSPAIGSSSGDGSSSPHQPLLSKDGGAVLARTARGGVRLVPGMRGPGDGAGAPESLVFFLAALFALVIGATLGAGALGARTGRRTAAAAGDGSSGDHAGDGSSGDPPSVVLGAAQPNGGSNGAEPRRHEWTRRPRAVEPGKRP